MSRKPVHVEIADAGGKLPGRRGVWAAVRELRTFTRAELRMRIPHVNARTANEYLESLVNGGFVSTGPMIEGSSRGCGKVRSYTLTRDIGVDAPRLRRDGTALSTTAQQRMWLAMKILGPFTAAILADAASTPEGVVPLVTAESYIRHLACAGYLSSLKSGGYYLVNDTGGHAPKVERTKVVFDPNLNRIMWHEVIEP
jgi:hypothetical protein